MTLEFANPWMLSLLWLVPALAIWWILVDRRRERLLAFFVSNTMQKKLRPPEACWRRRWQAALVMTGLAFVMIAAAGPQWGRREQKVFRRSRDLVLALDVSRSMLADDVHPNRLERAKADLQDLIGDLRGDRAALLAFRHKAILLCPLTTDYAFLRQTLDSIGPYSAPRGETDIGDAIRKAMEAFGTDTGSHRAIVLVSDGEDLTGEVADTADEAAEKGIPIFTVGLGNRAGSRIPDPDSTGYLRYEGEDVRTRLDHDTLLLLARRTGGAYVPIARASTARTTLGALYRNHLRKLTTRDIEETMESLRIERYQWFLLPGIILLLVGCGLSRGRLCMTRETAVETQAPPAQQPLKDLTPPREGLKNV